MRIINDELGKFRLKFSRCTNNDVAALTLKSAESWQDLSRGGKGLLFGFVVVVAVCTIRRPAI